MKELVKDFYEYIRALGGLQYLNSHLKYQLAPVIRGVKPSITLNITHHRGLLEQWDQYGEYILEELQLKYVALRKTPIGVILLIYHPDLIKEVLSHKEVNEFLESIGYSYLDVEGAIKYLAKRYKQHHCPHELGVFLGIPLDDVKSFIDNNQKRYIFCGYWKVYSDLNRALNLFLIYDRAKEEMIDQLMRELAD